MYRPVVKPITVEESKDKPLVMSTGVEESINKPDVQSTGVEESVAVAAHYDIHPSEFLGHLNVEIEALMSDRNDLVDSL